jgi:membrane-associated phospholipid phosphatase
MFDADRIARLDMFTRCAVGLTALVCVATPLYSHLSLDLRGTALPLLTLALMAGLALIYGRWRPARRIAAAAAMTADLIAFGLVFGAASYLAAAAGRPMMAAQFAAADHRLGFDWQVYVPFVRAIPALRGLLHFGYTMMVEQLGLVVIAFTLLGRFQWLRISVDAFGLMALTAIVLSGFFPAVDADVYFGAMVPQMTPQGWIADLQRVQDFLNLRDGFLVQIPVIDTTGIVTFPSFHTMCGFLFAVAFAQIRLLRWPAVAINALLIAATPVEGGHYFIDMLVGIALAAAILAAIFAYVRVRDPTPALALAAAE